MNINDNLLTKLEKGESVRIFYFKCSRCGQEFSKPNGLTCACPVCDELCSAEKEFMVKTVEQNATISKHTQDPDANPSGT